ncbi:MAG: PEP-CTERM sorting domain-containing protein [Rhodospirillales bacterium]|nr:MAG: PEP-CTERM sorting domain-containing protein [Rhodospirillales bacterium]
MALAAVVFSALLAGDVRAASLATELFVGKDSLETLTRGTYAGLRNPNYGRLTLLFNHDDHFHGIGVHSYVGAPPDDVSVQRTNTNNRIPEGYSGVPPVVLAPGDGLYAGKLVNRATEEEYTNTHIESVHRIPAAPEGLYDPSLFNSSNDRWSAPLDETTVALQLVSITPGLNVGGETSLNLFEDGHNHVLGDGNSLSVPLFFWTEADAPVGAYAAEFRLIDLGLAGLDPSGTFHLDFQVVPLPAAAWLFASAVLALGGLAGQKRLAERKAAGQPAS